MGVQNVINELLESRYKIILTLLYIELGLMKQIMKAWRKSVSCYEYIVHKLLGISMGKLKTGVKCLEFICSCS